MPSRFISRTTSSPNGVRPWCAGMSVAESAQSRVPSRASASCSARRGRTSGAASRANCRSGVRPRCRSAKRSFLTGGCGARRPPCTPSRSPRDTLPPCACTRSICSSVACTASAPLSSVGTQTDQNCPPTCPARSRGMSVINGTEPSATASFAVSDRRSIAARWPFERSRSSHGRSLCPSISGVAGEHPIDAGGEIAVFRANRTGRGQQAAQQENLDGPARKRPSRWHYVEHAITAQV